MREKYYLTEKLESYSRSPASSSPNSLFLFHYFSQTDSKFIQKRPLFLGCSRILINDRSAKWNMHFLWWAYFKIEVHSSYFWYLGGAGWKARGAAIWDSVQHSISAFVTDDCWLKKREWHSSPVACTDFLKGRGEKKGTLARVLAPKRAL